MARPVVLLGNLGTPRAPEERAVREFLAEFLADPDVVDWPRWLWLPILRGLVLRRRPARVAELYRSIWGAGGSPLEEGTRRLAAGLDRVLEGACELHWGWRHGSPSIAAEIERAAELGARRVLVVPLFPQRTAASSGSLVREARRAAARAGLESRLAVIAIPADDPGYLRALEARAREALEQAGGPVEQLLVSFHGIPARVDRREGSVYSGDCRATAAGLAALLGWDERRVSLAYQSRFGPERWLGPSTEDELERLARGGAQRVLLSAPGFLTEGLETLEELDLRGAATFRRAGGEALVRARAPLDHPELLESIAGRVRAALAAPAGRAMTPP